MRGFDVGRKALIDTVVGIGWLLDRPISRDDAAAALQVPVA